MIDLASVGFIGPDSDQRTRSGIILPPKPPARAWLKIAGEPVLVLYEDPPVAIARWIEWSNSDRPFVIFHDNQFGTPIFFTRKAIDQLAYISITHPTSEQRRTVPGSIYAGQCPCAEWGGTCPPLEA